MGSTNSRIFRAIDALLGNTISIGSNFVGGISERVKIRDEKRAELIKNAGELAAKNNSEVISNLAQAMAEKHAEKELNALENKVNIALLTTRKLEGHRISEEDESLDDFDEWMNKFEELSSHAKSERLQNIWASILSEKIRKNQSFSLSTLHVVSILDKKTAVLFQDFYNNSVNGKMAKGTISGEEYLNYKLLEENGLIHGLAGNSIMQFDTDIEGNFYFIAGSYAIHGHGTPQQQLHCSALALTRAGEEIGNILPAPQNTISGLRKITETIRPKGLLKRVDLVQVLSPPTTCGTYSFKVFETIDF